MGEPVRRISWVSAPPEVCCLCREPMTRPEEASSWNGRPAHRDCVRVHLLQNDSAFREGHREEPPEEAGDSADSVLSRDDEEGDFG